MRVTTLAAAVLAAAAALPAAAQAAEATFKVSLYGIQRFEKLDHEDGTYAEGRCFGSRGDIEERTTVKFHTIKPVKMRVSSSSSALSISPLTGEQLPLRVKAAVEHDGSYIKEERSCMDGKFGWILDPPPIPVNCSATVDNLGFGLVGGQRGRLEASGAEAESLAEDPFDGCPYGDHSDTLYTAKGGIKASLLLEGLETEVILRGKDKSRYEGINGSFVESRTKTTVYVTFKKVGK